MSEVKKKTSTPKKKKLKGDEVVIFSQRNIYFPEIGKISTGFNIVSKQNSEVYLTHKSVRQATAEELAQHYGR